ncbi:hypothetical protein CANCADRAFT_32114 [Tortispora caseinolytica NRRL Y-17796]|uniref:CID domain-containing protein n=1 Tax=Tortispora caseinolytica NRRL Y-17796 TaxID=767744 RepID=A0A1E4T9T7_9ASCO|nr:hypothetical protein CANCADRAFT_32114 [Tortispora caseinolytica NRRL Y-17796]
MDPFEARLKFVKMIQRMDPSSGTARRVGEFLMKASAIEPGNLNPEDEEVDDVVAEDLWSCVIEQLEQASINEKANILFFIESLAAVVAKASGGENTVGGTYKRLVAQDFRKVIELCVPERGGLTNLESARRVVESIKPLGLLSDTASLDALLNELSEKTQQGQTPQEGMSRKDILARMEQDRERHKRLKEQLWQIENNTIEDDFEQEWTSILPLTQKHRIGMKQQARIYTASTSL